MSAFVDRILTSFPADISRLWIAVDPDDVLLDERILAELRSRGFELLKFDDPIAFRLAYEAEFRSRWDNGDEGATKALVLHLQGEDASGLPADYLAEGRVVTLSLAALLPRMSYAVLRQLDRDLLSELFEAQVYAAQDQGELGTKEFVLLHIYRLSPHLILAPEELWAALFKLHYRGDGLPEVLARHVAAVLGGNLAFKKLPLLELFASRAAMLRFVQAAWERYLHRHGVSGPRIAEPDAAWPADVEIPFDKPEVRVYVDSMFLDGALHPIATQGGTGSLPEWAQVGVVPDPLARRNLVAQGMTKLRESIPSITATHREWGEWARRFGEVSSRHHILDASRAASLQAELVELRRLADLALIDWCRQHYGNLASLPAVKAPIMVHHVPRFLSMRRGEGESKIALIVFDGLAIDQWVTVRESLVRSPAKFAFEEGSAFAWLPTLTSVSRQAIFSGLRPREFADGIESTAAEPQHWARFWQDAGLKTPEVLYRKGLQRVDQLQALAEELSTPTVKVVGIVVDMIDQIIHGAKLGKSGVAMQIEHWCSTGFVAQLFGKLLDLGFNVYVTADHGNVDAVGVGKPNQGVAAEVRGERVRTYRSESVRSETVHAWPGTLVLDVPGLPAGFSPLYAGQASAFVATDEPVVVHGGPSVEELIVPFVKVSRTP
jgi:hypothetical protein